MKTIACLFAVLSLGCAVGDDKNANSEIWTLPKFKTTVAHTPKLDGYEQLKSEGVTFRKYHVHHPKGLWVVVMGENTPPIEITPAGGETLKLKGEWYPVEGGADAAAVYGFTKGDETLLVLQGTSAITYEETWVKFKDGKMIDLKRYAQKGGGMGDMPGEEPEYKTYPPEN